MIPCRGQRTNCGRKAEQAEKKLKREAEKARREERARQKAAENATMKGKRETIQELSKLNSPAWLIMNTLNT